MGESVVALRKNPAGSSSSRWGKEIAKGCSIDTGGQPASRRRPPGFPAIVVAVATARRHGTPQIVVAAGEAGRDDVGDRRRRGPAVRTGVADAAETSRKLDKLDFTDVGSRQRTSPKPGLTKEGWTRVDEWTEGFRRPTLPESDLLRPSPLHGQ